MTRIQPLPLLSLAFALLTACSARPVPAAQLVPAPAPTSAIAGKPGAPVAIDATLARTSARVSVRFEAAVDDAQVRVHGVDGLVVTSAATPIDGASFARGATRSFDVAFTPGSGRSLLVVTATTTSDGSPRTRVVSFAVGTRERSRGEAGASRAAEGGDERVHLLPVGE